MTELNKKIYKIVTFTILGGALAFLLISVCDNDWTQASFWLLTVMSIVGFNALDNIIRILEKMENK